MKLTNKYGCPEGLVEVVSNQIHPPKPNRFSVTDVIGPPPIRTLKIEKWDELETDVSEYLWLLLGIGVDYILSSVNVRDNITQYKMSEEIDCSTVVGITDVINGSIIDDYKCTSVWSFLYGEKPEWTAQLNTYAYLLMLDRLRAGGEIIPITKLRIQAILRDWQKSKTYDNNYPPIPFQCSELELWSFEQQEEYIKSRLRDHKENPYRECTAEEKWKSEDTYAVKSEYRKSAWRVLNSIEEAEKWIVDNKKGEYIETRLGVCKRCQDYCSVRSVCPYTKEK